MVPGYREVRQLGAGRTGRVFLATYQETGAYVAIKYLNAALRRDSEFMARYTAETPRLVELDDPHVVRLHEYVETPTRAAVVMELVDGVPLRTILAERGRMSPEAALVVLRDVLRALAAAHAKGVLHRDLKPENVLVQADGAGKVTDFGVVGYVEEPGVPPGTPPYLAPELWRGEPASQACDLYAAACLLFECVMGRPPYRGSTAEVRDRHLSAPVPLEPAPDTLRDLLRRGLAKDPAGRYGSAARFAAELEEDALAGYGPDWADRGRRHLAELATLLALRFPLAKADQATAATTVARTRRSWVSLVPRMPPHLWIAGGAVVAVLVAVLVSGGGRGGPFLMPPAESPHAIDPDPADNKSPTSSLPPGTAQPGTTRPGVTQPGATRPGTAPPETRGPAPTPTGSQGLPATVPPVPTPTSAPTASRSPGPAGGPAVRQASIMGWSGSAGAVRVDAVSAAPIRLKLAYTRRDGDGPARTVHTETHTLSGQTAYTHPFTHDLGDVPCGRRAYFGVIVATEPASAQGPQVREVPMDGPACPAPTSTDATGSGTPGPSAAPSAGRTSEPGVAAPTSEAASPTAEAAAPDEDAAGVEETPAPD
ncbi:serine/threonine-protein kinase [Thermoactinospora rubra]|uniref:serine/threonine-protein kinase n=1 Tax=Thermoactinospora rubra TaxID=1088767 RepID=UPI001301FDF0|nr:serine/threonine-protein kinase [Thermoactinospora rubra]